MVRVNKRLAIVTSLAAALVLLVIILYSVYSSDNNHNPEETVVAKVGNAAITANEFIRNYEFGYPILKKGKDVKEWKRSYLNYMINEKLLALKGYQLGLDKTKKVNELRDELISDLMVESLINTEVKSRIKITQSEIKDAINKSKVNFKFNFWAEPTLKRAEYAESLMKKDGFKSTVLKILKTNPEVHIDPSKFQTDYIKYDEVDPSVLNAIKNLPIGEISNPVEIGGKYFIFQVEDIRREAVTEQEYLAKSPSVRKVLFNKKFKAAVVNYIDAFMTPKDVVTKRYTFRYLTDAFLEWKYQDTTEFKSFREAVRTSNRGQKNLYKLKENINQPLVKYKGGGLSVNQVLDLLNVSVIHPDPKHPSQAKSELNRQIAITVRNYLLAKEGHEKNLEHLPSVKKKLKEWEDKWVYEEARSLFTKDVKLSDDQIHEYFSGHSDKYKTDKNVEPSFALVKSKVERDAYLDAYKKILDKKIEELKKNYNVKINYDVLDTLKVSGSQKSKQMFVDIYQAGTGRPAVPITDAAWGL